MSHVDILLPHIIIYTPALPVSSFAAEGSIGEHRKVHYTPDGCISIGAGQKIESLLYDRDWKKLGRTE